MESLNIPTARRNVFLDNDDEEEKIIAQLMELAQKASELGFAIGIGHVNQKLYLYLKIHTYFKAKRESLNLSKMLH